jgi:hypothetical protein
MSEPKDSRRLRIAWAVIVGEFLLFAAALFVFLDYWIMLPIRYRIYGVSGLSLVALIGIIRLVRLYRKGR